MCVCPQTPQGAVAGLGRTKRSPEVELGKNKQDYLLQLPTALPRHQVSLCTPLLLRGGAVSTDWSCCTMRGKVFISCGLEQPTWSNSPKGAALSEAFNNLLGRYFFPFVFPLCVPHNLSILKSIAQTAEKRGEAFLRVPLPPEQSRHYTCFFRGVRGMDGDLLFCFPCQARPGHAGKKENETHFWDQGRKMGTTPLHCYFQPEIS